MPTHHVVLIDHQVALAEHLVASGRYQNASEVLREGLPLLDIAPGIRASACGTAGQKRPSFVMFRVAQGRGTLARRVAQDFGSRFEIGGGLQRFITPTRPPHKASRTSPRAAA